jgi:glycosyltransferase involved in cell wall biosynthesis
LIRSLSVIIPAYNEAARLPATLDRVTAYLAARRFEFAEILVVDDGSTDGGAEQAEQFALAHPGVYILRNPGNRGKGYAVRNGMIVARGEWRLFTDADLSSPIEELEKLEQAVVETRADIAIGSRALNRSLISVHQPAYREAAGKFFNLVMRFAVGLPFHDTQCGFKLFSRAAAETVFPRQRLERFGFDVEALLIARLHGFHIAEVPVRWAHVEGTKVSTLSGAQSFVDLLVVRLNQLAGKYR